MSFWRVRECKLRGKLTTGHCCGVPKRHGRSCTPPETLVQSRCQDIFLRRLRALQINVDGYPINKSTNERPSIITDKMSMSVGSGVRGKPKRCEFPPSLSHYVSSTLFLRFLTLKKIERPHKLKRTLMLIGNALLREMWTTV